MSELKRKIIKVLFWIFLIISIILIVWKIVGSSPNDLSIIVSVTLMLMFKMWDIGDDLKDFKYDVKLAFRNVRGDINELKTIKKTRRK